MNYQEMQELAKRLNLTDLEGKGFEELQEELEDMDVIKKDCFTKKMFDATQGYYVDEEHGLEAETLENLAKWHEEEPAEFIKRYNEEWEENDDSSTYWTKTEL